MIRRGPRYCISMVNVLHWAPSTIAALDYPGPGVMILATLATFAFIFVGGWWMYRCDMRYRQEMEKAAEAAKHSKDKPSE